MDKYIIFTSNATGGIAQFAILLASNLQRYSDSKKFLLMVPSSSSYSKKDGLEVKKYSKKKTIFPNKNKFRKILDIISNENPTHIIFAESSIPNHQLSKYLHKFYRLFIIIHDVKPHPKGFSLKENIKDLYRYITLKRNINRFENVVLLSETVRKQFIESFKRYKGNIINMKLCSHLMSDDKYEDKLFIKEEYFLFFGRIEKYKGVEYLLKAYNLDIRNELPKLVIAGSGELSNIEKNLYNRLQSKIIFINRYISDNELANLVQGSKAIVLPYIEASQSGIIPIAYQYSKPVIASRIDGLVENIIDTKTGFTFDTKDYQGLYIHLKKLAQKEYDYIKLEENIKNFYNEFFDWRKNIMGILNSNL